MAGLGIFGTVAFGASSTSSFEQFWADAQKANWAEKSEASQRRMDWWRGAKFGMFIHWNPSSVAAGEISWSKQFCDGTGERLMDNPRPSCGLPKPKEHHEWLSWFQPPVPKEVYDYLPKSFYPGMFDADKLVGTAKAAGMKYIVQVSKHHDGFCMWDTKFTDFNVMNTPFHRDILGEMAKACERAGIVFGIYYSQRDWHHPDYGPERMAQYNEYMRNQIHEMLVKYPNIRVVWFDSSEGYPWQLWESDKLFRMIHELRPEIVINNRCGVPADFSTPEQKLGAFNLERDWESCMTFTGYWSWRGFQTTVIPYEECLLRLVRCAGGNGNLLMNIGPLPTGQIDPRETDRLVRIGAWLEKNGESIYGTSGGPFPPGDYGVSTHKGNKVYVHVLKWPEGEVKLAPIPERIISARVLNGGSAAFRQTGEGVNVSVSADSRPVDTVIVLNLESRNP